MTDNFPFILRWKIDNATAKLATGKAESGVFDKEGFKWTAKVEECEYGFIDFFLQCGVDHNRPWTCEVDIDVFLATVSGTRSIKEGRGIFNEQNGCCSIDYHNRISWSLLRNPWFKINDTVTFEVHVNFVRSERGELSKFAAPNNKSNVILKIGDEKLHVTKEYLAVHSPVFDTLFFGDFAEKGKEEIELKDVVYEEFLDLLNLVYLETVEMTDRSVVHILKLADQFQMERVLNISAKHLIKSKRIGQMRKLLLSDQYRLTALKDHCLNSFTSATDLTVKVKSSAEYANFSADMQAAILEQIVKLT